jgi:hypothetical protein
MVCCGAAKNTTKKKMVDIAAQVYLTQQAMADTTIDKVVDTYLLVTALCTKLSHLQQHGNGAVC